MHIIHLTTEMAPIAKIGGLADVTLGLTREQVAQGHRAEIIMPKYDVLDLASLKDLTCLTEDFPTYFDGETHPCSIWEAWYDGVHIYLIGGFPQEAFFNRGQVYGCEDDVDRFCYFSRVAVDFLLQNGTQPDLIHLHDWCTSVAAPYCKMLTNKKIKTVLTIHNINYQGKCLLKNLQRIGIVDPDLLETLIDPQDPSVYNLLKGAIVHCDFSTTVSPTYAIEVQESPGGRGLEGVIAANKHKFSGVLNGIDYLYWDPSRDPMLTGHYSARDIERDPMMTNPAAGKRQVQYFLRERLSLEHCSKPIVSSIARLIPQKGIELMKYALFRTLDKGGQFILLGTSPYPDIQAEFLEIKNRFQGHPDVHLALYTNEALAHQIFAASDMVIVPSIFEPCGLTQMIGLRYGAVPIARRTGGLADTVFDVETSGLPKEQTNGFTFDYPDMGGINWALDRAIQRWYQDPLGWRELALRGMKMDSSWRKPAQRYLEIYESI